MLNFIIVVYINIVFILLLDGCIIFPLSYYCQWLKNVYILN